MTKAQCLEVSICNPCLFAGSGVPYIAYNSATTGMASQYARWSVYRWGFKVDPTNWRGGYSQEFSVTCRENKEPVLAEAKAWASTRYGITEWVKTPFGSYMDAGFVAKRLAELKAQYKAKKELDKSTKEEVGS